MQQVLYLARHRGVALPRGISDQQLAAACRRVNERTLLKVWCRAVRGQLLGSRLCVVCVKQCSSCSACCEESCTVALALCSRVVLTNSMGVVVAPLTRQS
jgi:hypothetical protein